MIDDGSCEVILRGQTDGGARFRSSAQVDLDWFLSLRCEQLRNGQPLVDLLDGLGAGCNIGIDVLVASVEDPHHSWESIFRAVGIGLEKLATGTKTMPTPAIHEPLRPVDHRTESIVERGWRLAALSSRRASLARETAESVVSVDVELGAPGAECRIAVSDSVDVTGTIDLLRELAFGAGLRVSVDFTATRLSSSHVVMEDIGLTLGRALREIAVIRMAEFGIYGAGSNIALPDLIDTQPVRVGVSMEGRKFWKYVPLGQDYETFRKRFLVGHTLANGLYTEDLDDFIDGLAGGLQSSVIVHVERRVDPTIGWPLIFRGLGEAIAELMRENPDRKALTPGVKATLA
jgi:imidazoleglycerol phosphate dehydratase HisB